MNKKEYSNYLNSDHWKELKLKKSKHAKRCWCCKSKSFTKNFHHVRYKQIFDVNVHDIRLLCEDCHQLYHAVKNESSNLTEKEIWQKVRKIKKALG